MSRPESSPGSRIRSGVGDPMWDRQKARDEEGLWTARSALGVVSSSHYLASNAGASVLSRGGNAVDAAVATSAALSVCEPSGSGLGGMMLMLVYCRENRRTFVIEGECRAPSNATPDAIRATNNRYLGYSAVAVPRQVAVLRHALAKYGRLSRSEVLAPAIELASDGFPLTRLASDLLRTYANQLKESPAPPVFFNDDGTPKAAGERFRQPALARTLERLDKEGFEDFYLGEIGRHIVEDIAASGGFVTISDLEQSLAVEESEPLQGVYRGATVRSVGPPGGGLSLLEMLQIASCSEPNRLDLRSPESLPLVAAIVRRCRTDRRRFRLRIGARGVGGADLLLDPSYAKQAFLDICAEIDGLAKNHPSNRAVQPTAFEATGGETSHFNVVDRDGNVVAATQSIERSFGASVCSTKLGFLYNGYLRAFKVRNRAHPHYLTAGAPARSNAAPTLLFRGEEPCVAVGSTGAERMLSGILESVLRLEHESPFEAVRGARLHCSPEGIVSAEISRLPEGAKETLARCGLAIEELEPYSFKMGGLQLVVRDGPLAIGVADPRRDGAATGPVHST